MSKIELHSVTKTWGTKPAVDALSLTMEDGTLTALLGPSGCGKSTTLMMLAGIYAPTSGEILFDGERVNEVEPRDRNIGIVFQSYALYPNMSVRDNILFPLRFQGKVGSKQQKLCHEMAELVEIGALLDRKPAELSGGQQQRVALARALIKKPNLLLLDEPLSNLDASLRLTMRTEIKKIQRELGVTTILVTHDQLEATTMADRVICMKDGRAEQVGTADDLYCRPQSRFIASFIGSPSMNLLPASTNGASITSSAGSFEFPIPYQGNLILGMRPEDILFAEAGHKGRIVSIEPMGREILYAVESDFGLVRVLEAGAQARLSIDEQVNLTIDPSDFHLFEESTGQRLQSHPTHS